MKIPGRRFVKLVGAIGVGSLLPRNGIPDSSESMLSYQEIRSLLEGKKLFPVPYCHNDYGWLNSNRWDRARVPLVRIGGTRCLLGVRPCRDAFPAASDTECYLSFDR